MTNLDVSIRGMHCDACKHTLEDALGQMPGVHFFEVNLGSARITFDENQVGKGEVLDALREAGPYEVAKFSIST